MPITILPPIADDVNTSWANANDDSDAMSTDSDGGVNIGEIPGHRHPRKYRRPSSSENDDIDIITPGEAVTDDPQWMRLVL